MSKNLPFRYLAITDHTTCPEPIEDRIATLDELGVPAIQIRGKTVTDSTLTRWLNTIPETNTYYLMNGRIDLALIHDLNGVHLPSKGLPFNVVKSLGNKNMLYGRSTHTIDEIATAFSNGADYVLFGPIFETPSKPDIPEDQLVGLSGLRQATDRFDGPIFALGGITPDKVQPCVEAGAYGVAGIRALFQPEDPAANWSTIRRHLPSNSSENRVTSD